jgi:hypothetical protein
MTCYCSAKTTLKAFVHNFALYSPMLGLCGTCPNLGSATSPCDARDAARPSPPRSKPCQTVGLLPTVRCVEPSAGICRQRYSGERSPPSAIRSTTRRSSRGEMKRAIARKEQDRRTQDRFASTIVIAASIIAAVRSRVSLTSVWLGRFLTALFVRVVAPLASDPGFQLGRFEGVRRRGFRHGESCSTWDVPSATTLSAR